LGDKDGRMDAMKSSGAFPPDESAEEAPAAANATLVVEDLVDLKEFKDPDKNVAENENTLAPLVTPMAEETEAKTSPVDSQPSSIVTYELPPPEMVDLPVTHCVPF
jgi:chromatin segregation and condensation protein Rec8/ScpA/Scc1 (kleisin family)